jgi:hypothetical protein
MSLSIFSPAELFLGAECCMGELYAIMFHRIKEIIPAPPGGEAQTTTQT